MLFINIHKKGQIRYDIEFTQFIVVLSLIASSTTYTWAQNVCQGGPCLWRKMPMLQKAGMREGGLPLPPAFQ
jgi:hypothetical protein